MHRLADFTQGLGQSFTIAGRLKDIIRHSAGGFGSYARQATEFMNELFETRNAKHNSCGARLEKTGKIKPTGDLFHLLGMSFLSLFEGFIGGGLDEVLQNFDIA